MFAGAATARLAPLFHQRDVLRSDIPMLKKYQFHLLMLLVLVAIAEGFSYLAFTMVLNKKEFIYKDMDSLRDSDDLKQLQGFIARNYDSLLGWEPPPNAHADKPGPTGVAWSLNTDARGVRINPGQPEQDGPATISIYGDSFTFCDEVSDDQTWGHYLSQLTDTGVDNWGVGGYGTDQAFLRLKRNLPEQHSDIVVLAVFSENINRIMNNFRPFYSFSSGIKFGFKPMLRQQDGNWRWMPNPLQLTEPPQDMQPYRQAFDKARKTDFWYKHNQGRPKSQFPYSLALAKTVYYYLFENKINLYKVPEAEARMDHLIKDFIALSRAGNFKPVLLFIPQARDLYTFFNDHTYWYSDYITHLRAMPELEGMPIIDLLEHPFDAEKFNTIPFHYHASPYGNKVVAEVVYEQIKPLLADLPPPPTIPAQPRASPGNQPTRAHAKSASAQAARVGVIEPPKQAVAWNKKKPF